MASRSEMVDAVPTREKILGLIDDIELIAK